MELYGYELYENMEEKIKEMEKKLNVKLPEDYLGFVKKYNFTRFKDVYFKDDFGNERSIVYAYSIDIEIGDSVSGNGKYVNEALGCNHDRYLPILDISNIKENYIACISYDIEDKMKLYVIEYNDDGEAEYIAETFTEFLLKLYIKKSEPKYPLERERIQELEKKLKIKFPEKFVQEVEKYNGESVNGKELYKTKSGEERGFTGFLNYNNDAKYDEFLKTYNDLVKYCKPSFPKKEVYPFSPTAGGDYLCLDYRQNKENPKVVYFTHDTFYGEEYETIAESFDEWFSSLYPDPDKKSAIFEL